MSKEVCLVYEVLLFDPDENYWFANEFLSYGKAERYALRNVSEDTPEVRIYAKTYDVTGSFFETVQRLHEFTYPLSLHILKETGVI